VDGLVNGEIRDPGLLSDAPRNTVYRFFNASKGQHFYTSDTNERAAIIANSKLGFKEEGSVYDGLATQGKSVYRFFNTKTGDYLYTTDENERATVIKNSAWGYVQETSGFSVSTESLTGIASPISRFYREAGGVGQHFYTSSAQEAATLTAFGYRSEGILGYI
jgi:hypothetical protein